MIHNTETAILPFKVLELVKIIAEKKRLSFSDSLFYLYNSELYHKLDNPKLKLWYYSGYELYEILEEEKLLLKRVKISSNEARFLVFCIEQYRLYKNQPSASVLEMFINLGVDDFLIKNFELLHSQGAEYILREIDVFIKRRK